MGCELVAVPIFRSEHGGPTRCRHEWRHGTGVNPSAETIRGSDTRRSMVFPSPHSLFCSSMVLGW